MKTLPTALATHYASGTTTLADLLKITRKDGQVFAFTSASTDVTISGQLYTSAQGLDISSLEVTAGLAVDNLELTTLDDGSIFSRVEVLAGVWRNADFIISRYNWANPADGVEVRMVGTVGEVHLKRGSIAAELRGLQQYLQQPIGSVTSKTCRARLGDALCGVNLAGYSFNGVVTDGGAQQFVDFMAGPSVPGITSLILHGDGANAGTVFTDSGYGNKTATRIGTTTTSTAQVKFGTASMLFNGSSALAFASSTDFSPVDDDFTVRCWVYRTAASFGVVYCRTNGVANQYEFELGILAGGGVRLSGGLSGAVSPTAFSAGTVPLNTWTHLAGVKRGLEFKIYIAGVLDGSVAAASSLAAGSRLAVVGARDNNVGGYGSYFTGHIDDLSVVKGIALYNDNFAVPTSATPDTPPELARAGYAQDYFTDGIVTFTSGSNAGLSAKVKTHFDSGTFLLALPLVTPVLPGDSYTAVAGCRKRLEDCSAKFNNVLNFQGEPHLPGVDQITAPA